MHGVLLSVMIAHISGEVGAVPPLVTAEGDRYNEAGEKVKDPAVFGFQLDLGLPDGAGASVMVLPAEWVAVHIAGLHNGAGAGLRLGVELIAFPSWRLARPTVSFDVGTFSAGDATFLTPLLQGQGQAQLRSMLSSVSYQFANLQGGFEFGMKSVSLVVRGGVSWVDGIVGNPSVQLGSTTLSANGIRLHGFIPSGRLGLMFCF